MNRYFSLRDEVLHLLDEKSHGYYKREAIAHMFQVETLCVLLAKERGLDEELCAIIGLLHDVAVPIYSSSFQHATRSSDLRKNFLVQYLVMKKKISFSLQLVIIHVKNA